MKKEKTIFSEDLSKYAAFVEATNEGLENAVEEMKQQIETRKKILQIVQTYQDQRIVSMKDLAGLAHISCPDFHSLDTLLELIEGLHMEPISTYVQESEYKKSIDCSQVSCTECWQNYINKTAHILNMSPIDIKNYMFTSDKDEDDK